MSRSKTWTPFSIATGAASGMIGRSRWNGAKTDWASARRPAEVCSFLPPIVPGPPRVHTSATAPKLLRMKSRRDHASAGGRNGFGGALIRAPSRPGGARARS